ncbi:MAG TPA: protein kinase [Chloroflexota bacterium]|nr:protein kinase [Chloroflexota bacterium]
MIPEKINRYEIKRELGRGGMASVYEAYDPQFQRPVAVKLLPREFLHDPEFRARFTREARTIAALEHPAIVPVYDFGEEDGQPFLVMRLMTGGSLTDRLANGPLPIDEAAEILKRIGSALDRAHSQGIIHRDLKPGNILFDHYGDAFLADFGIARIAAAGSQLTASGSLVGTPTYMSPEQVYGNKELDGRSDIYALGVILYQMLTGEIPFDADTPARMMMAHVMNPVPHLVDKRPDLAPCDLVISKAMAKERDDRFSTASDMTNELAAITQKMKQPDLTAVTPPPITPTPEPIHPEPAVVATAAAAATTAVPEPAPTLPPRPAAKASSSFEEPAFSKEIAAPDSHGTKSPVWLLALLGFIAILCLGGTAFGGYLAFNSLTAEETVTPTAVAELDNDNGGTSVFTTFDEATDTPIPPATPVPTDTAVPEATPLPTDTAVPAVNDALATRQSLEATRAAAGGQTDNNNSGSGDALATRQSLEATRAAEIGSQPVNLFGELSSQNALLRPTSGELPHDPDDNTIEMFYPGISAADFVLNVHFLNPYPTQAGSWDFGVTFRQEEPDEELRLVVRSDGLWNLNNRSQDGDEFVQDGNVSGILDLRPNEANQLTLIAIGDSGVFFLNEEFITTLDLSARQDEGEIALGTGFYTTNERRGATTQYEDFAIWPMEPAYGPANGELEHALDDLIKLDESGVRLRNLLTAATFENPFAAATNDFDFGFSFRDDNDGTKYWLVIASEGEWELVGRFGDADSDTTLQSGNIRNLNLGDGESNDLALIVWGETGYFFVNGEFIEQLDLFDITTAGDVEVFTAFYFDHEIEDESTDYEEFTVWPLP